MSFTGKWKFHSIGTLGDDGIVYMNEDEYLNSPMSYIDDTDPDAIDNELRERRTMIGTEIRVCDNGEFYMLMPLPADVPKEEIDAAVEAGEIKSYDGMMYDSPMKWEERDGELWAAVSIDGMSEEGGDGMSCLSDKDGYLNFINIRFAKEE